MCKLAAYLVEGSHAQDRPQVIRLRVGSLEMSQARDAADLQEHNLKIVQMHCLCLFMNTIPTLSCWRASKRGQARACGPHLA